MQDIRVRNTFVDLPELEMEWATQPVSRQLSDGIRERPREWQDYQRHSGSCQQQAAKACERPLEGLRGDGASASQRPATSLGDMGGEAEEFADHGAAAECKAQQGSPELGISSSGADFEFDEAVDPEEYGEEESGPGNTLLPGSTTVMIRHIPTKLPQKKLIKEIHRAGFAAQYDFLYLPMDGRSQANRGFAFVNFVAPDIAQAFFDTFNGTVLTHLDSTKVVTVGTAHLQGFQANAEHYQASVLCGRRRSPYHKPLFMPHPVYPLLQAQPVNSNHSEGGMLDRWEAVPAPVATGRSEQPGPRRKREPMAGRHTGASENAGPPSTGSVGTGTAMPCGNPNRLSLWTQPVDTVAPVLLMAPDVFGQTRLVVTPLEQVIGRHVAALSSCADRWNQVGAGQVISPWDLSTFQA